MSHNVTSRRIHKNTLAVLARLPVGEDTARVLAMLSVVPDSADLLHSTPGIAVCVAAQRLFIPGISSDSDVRWAQQKRRVICGELGFPAEERTVKILGRVPAEHSRAWSLLPLRRTLHRDALAKLLSHMRLIGQHHLEVAKRLWDAEAVAPSLFAELATWRSEKALDGFCTSLSDVVWLHRHLERRVPVFRSTREVMLSHERIVEAAGRLGPSEAEPMQLIFPPAPFKSLAGTEPITTPAELREEGRTMENCVFRYARPVALGRVYFYSQRVPRATIGLVNRGSKWSVFDIRANNNERVSSEVTNAVKAWVAGAQSGS